MFKKPEKRIVQDIVASSRRTLRRVPPHHIEVVEEDGEEQVPFRSPSLRPRRKISSLIVTFVVVFVCIAVIAVALSLLYSKAAVTITPKTAHFNVSTTVTAKKSDGSMFGYEVVSATETETQIIPAVDGPLVETKAKGTVTLYNEQEVQQKIVAGTRLSNADGLVYRTTATVVIPQAKAAKTPGSIAVAVLADKAGASYNMALNGGGDFKFVAYKGGPKYTTVYGKLKTSLTGGFSGSKKTISPEVQKVAIQNLKDSLAVKLVEDAKSLVSRDSIMYENAYTIDYEVSEPVSKDAQTADISVKGTLSGAKFKKTDLLKSIAGKELDKFSAPTYRIE